jgi:hypothetical protein
MKFPAEMAGVSKHIATTSAMNPTLLLCLICTPVGLGLTAVTTGVPRVALFVIAVLPMLLAIWQIILFTLSDRDRLHNEKHVENKMMISRLGVRIGDETQEIILPASGERVDNPMIEGVQ